MTLATCGDIVRRGDPDRFLAAMAARPAARAVLFPLYAFNVEVARAPWMTAEPLIARMRLQWWRDVLEEIGARGVVRRHEVTTPLAQVLDRAGAGDLDRAVAAREWDVDGSGFADADALWAHLDATGGTLMWTAARLLGAGPGEEPALRRIARAGALASWLTAVPALVAAGREPLPDAAPGAVATLAADALSGMRGARASMAARPATWAAWRARPLLRMAARDPGLVASGGLVQSEFARRAGLARLVYLGR